MRVDGQNNQQAPLVILLDIDGTLIGDITPQILIYEILGKLRQFTKCPYNLKDLQSRLNEGIIRPYFKSFFKELSDYGVEIFIYTASEKKWAEFIVKQIEASVGIKFNRPLFTRNNCQYTGGEYMKKIGFVKPMVIKTLNRKYNTRFSPDLRNRIIAIDNRRVYFPEDEKYLVLCDTYNYKIPENLPFVLRRPVFEKHHNIINHMLAHYFSNYKSTSNYMKFEKQFYYQYIDTLTFAIRNKEHSFSDSLFKSIKTYILSKNIKIFNPETVHHINNKIKNNKHTNETRSFF